jgi:DNA-binding protein Fis
VSLPAKIHTGQNKTSAASILGIDRRTIKRLASREADKDANAG